MTMIALIDRNWYNVTASFFFAKKRSLCLKQYSIRSNDLLFDLFPIS